MGLKLAIVDPISKSVCPNGIVGEIWINSNSSFTGLSGAGPSENRKIFGSTLPSGDFFARSGDLGFRINIQDKNTPKSDEDNYNSKPANEIDDLFVLGTEEEHLKLKSNHFFKPDLIKIIESSSHLVVPSSW